MRMIVVLVAAVALAGCSSTQNEPRQTATASTIAQDQVDQFCKDVADALTRDGQADPEDSGERLQELKEIADELGLSTRDDMSVARALKTCEDELQAALDAQ